MEKLILLILGLATVGFCDEDPVELFATEEIQNLTSPNLDGITRPKDFRWRIWLNASNTDTAIRLRVDYLNITETVNCTGSYLEIIPDGESEGRMCESFEVYRYKAYESYFDIILHVGPGTDTPEFHMIYKLVEPTFWTSYNYEYLYWLQILVPIGGAVVIVGCCSLRMLYKKRQTVREANVNRKENPSLPAAFTGPPSYDDVIKADSQPPPYTSLA